MGTTADSATLEEIMQGYISTRSRESPNFMIVNTKHINVSGMPTAGVSYTYTDSSTGNTIYALVMFSKSDKIFSQVYFDTLEDNFQATLPDALNMFSSINLPVSPTLNGVNRYQINLNHLRLHSLTPNPYNNHQEYLQIQKQLSILIQTMSLVLLFNIPIIGSSSHPYLQI